MQERPASVPPYVPYRTFRTFLEFLLEMDAIPDRIDRSVWGSRFSGNSGTQLMTALKVLKLVDAGGRPMPALEHLVYAEGEERRTLLRGILQDYYSPVFELDLARATRNQFRTAFRSFGAREGVLTKCEAFFVQAARDAGVQLSQYVLAGRHVSRRRLPSARQRQPPVQQMTATPPPEANTAPTQPTAQPVRLPVSSVAQSRVSIAEMVLSKYPDFDPAWSQEVQAKWLEGMTRLYDGLSSSVDRAEPQNE